MVKRVASSISLYGGWFFCPECHAPIWSAEVSTFGRHTPTPNQVQERPYLSCYGHEVLICKCGHRSNWFAVEEVF